MCHFVIRLRTNLEEARVQKDQRRIENKTIENIIKIYIKNREIAASGVAGFKVRSKVEGGVPIFCKSSNGNTPQSEYEE